ncbi:MAG TPA: TetR/AcrR family transcriptional regulator [Solidesulfovibrio magneticus]|nr:TetR/AcrR family transcriptional regulator [Solidesulfovibrio magneticus]
MRRKRIDVTEGYPVSKRKPSGAAVMQPGVTEALTRALFIKWAESGYAALSLEAVAKLAGVGKAALYRRWPSKQAMVLDRLEAVGLHVTDAPDQGSLAGDVRALLLAVRRVLRHPLVRRIVADLHAEIVRTAELREAVRTFQTARRERADALLARAVARGELPGDLDFERAKDLLAAPLYWRMVVLGEPATRDYIAGLVDTTVAALRNCARTAKPEAGRGNASGQASRSIHGA